MDARTQCPKLASAIALLLITSAVCRPASAGTVVVDENNLDWGFQVETGSPGSGFQGGPDTPPIGTGSAYFDITGASDGVLIGTQLHNGLRLVDLTTLSYCTYQETTPQAVALQFNIDYDDTDGSTGWQGRLVYEPYYTEPVMAGIWQCWDTLTQVPTARGGRVPSGVGNWWSTGTPVVGDVAQAPVCTIGAPCAFSEILSLYPDIAVHQGALGALVLKAGSAWPGPFRFSVDQLDVATQATGVTYDFENAAIPVELLSLTVD